MNKNIQSHIGIKLTLTLAAVMVVLLSSLFFWIAKRQETQIITQVEQQARVLFKQIVLTRAWVAGQAGGGVFSKVTGGVEPNPYLLEVEDLMVNITTDDSTLYTLRNPALVTRELSELAESEEAFSFHITSLKPFNPNNAATDWERKALESFESGEAEETKLIETTSDGEVYRYMAPLYVKENCLRCHAQQGYEVGDVRGGISVTIPMDDTRAAIQANARQTYALGFGFAVLMLGTLGIFVNSQITRPLGKLQEFSKTISQGDMTLKIPVHSQDELGNVAIALNTMTAQMRENIGNLEQRVATRTRALETSTEVSRRLSTILDQDRLVKEVVEQLVSSFGYYYAHIYLFEDDKNTLVMKGGTGEAGQVMLSRSHTIQKGRGLVGRAAESNAVVLVGDTLNEEGWLPNVLLPETRAEIAVPISIGAEVLGVFDVQHNVLSGLTEEDVSLMQSIANQVAISIQNTEGYIKAQRTADREALIGTISQNIQNATTIEDTLQVAVRELGHALNAEHSTVQLSLQAKEEEQD
ncbi:MAG: DUF3365 domain-containing protein [Anaerolineae bacterium]|jgi:putative methionine-R-sulfoxide reductase with GAF domain|nr:DUF3365 domain-containing protein [Anaerolineae bacterium]MBT7074253.1 DUF3365 domain-containing protein [Anaerolineae bacterium]